MQYDYDDQQFMFDFGLVELWNNYFSTEIVTEEEYLCSISQILKTIGVYQCPHYATLADLADLTELMLVIGRSDSEIVAIAADAVKDAYPTFKANWCATPTPDHSRIYVF